MSPDLELLEEVEKVSQDLFDHFNLTALFGNMDTQLVVFSERLINATEKYRKATGKE